MDVKPDFVVFFRCRAANNSLEELLFSGVLAETRQGIGSCIKINFLPQPGPTCTLDHSPFVEMGSDVTCDTGHSN